MTRGFGEVALAGDLPTAVVVLAALVTQFGDVWFVFLLLGLCYWFGPALPGPVSFERRTGAFLVALGLGASAVVTTLKHWFAYPRPPGAGEAVGTELVPALFEGAYAAAATGDGFGFPSGHALGATVIYGGLALSVGSRRGYAAAAVLVPVIALTRVVLGVHYAVDVVAGVAVGGVYLAAVWRLCDRGSNAGRALMVALAFALAGAAIEYNGDTMAALGGVLGARIAWGTVGDAVLHGEATRAGGIAATALGVGFASLFGGIHALEFEPYVAFLGIGVSLAGVFAAPLLGEAAARRLTGGSASNAPTSD